MRLPLRRPPMSSLVYFFLALVLALAAAAMVNADAQRVRAAHPDVGAPVAVVAASGSLARGSILGPDDVRTISIPSSLVPPGSFRSPDEVGGRVLVADIADGEIVTASRLGRSGAGPVSALVPAGLRAFSMPAAVPRGSLSPGDLIDVIGTFGANGGRPYTDTVATELPVLHATPSTSSASAAGPPTGTITVLADPGTVEALARAVATGIVSFSIVGDEPSPAPSIPPAGPPATASPSAPAG